MDQEMQLIMKFMMGFKQTKFKFRCKTDTLSKVINENEICKLSADTRKTNLAKFRGHDSAGRPPPSLAPVHASEKFRLAI